MTKFLPFIFLFVSCSSQSQKYFVYVFLSSECPLSIEQTLTLNDLQAKYKEVTFIGVFPNEEDSAEKIIDFSLDYNLSFKVEQDVEHILVKKFNATTTPEAILTTQFEEILYSGMIDNRMVTLGKKRKVVTEHYLEEAILQILSKKEIKVKKTEPIGCLIFSEV
jgi:hypothetical protein